MTCPVLMACNDGFRIWYSTVEMAQLKLCSGSWVIFCKTESLLTDMELFIIKAEDRCCVLYYLT